MRKAFLLVLAAAAIVPAMLANQVGDTGVVRIGYEGSSYGMYQTGSGGEFTLTPTTPWLGLDKYAAATKNVGVNGSFQTFCVEGNEFISGYATTYTATISQNAIYGSVGPGGDPISVGTGWLYKQFATGSWGAGLSYNYVDLAGRKSDAGLLQKAIWWLEGEQGIAYSAGNIYMKAAKDKFGSEAAAQANGGWNYGVYALNLTRNGARAQDQLVLVPDGGLTLMLLGLGLGGVGLVSRKLRK